MRKYKDVPIWWYCIVFLILFGISLAFIYVEKTELPWWGLILALLIVLVLLVPVGIMQAMCNIGVSTAVISAFIAGFIWPGNTMNNVVFKIFLLTSVNQGLGYVKDMKLGHYMVRILLGIGFKTVISTYSLYHFLEDTPQNNFRCPECRNYSVMGYPSSR